MKTYVVRFIHKDGNGWAVVNARSPQQAEQVFKIQTKFKVTKVVDLKEIRYVGCEMQLVFEGAVATIAENPYDLAVLNGYTGTLSEWLESIKGEKGDKGDRGDRGNDGTNGENGTDGYSPTVDLSWNTEGTVGVKITVTDARGSQSEIVPMGPVGPEGPKGDTGEKGDKGDQGEKGDTGPTWQAATRILLKQDFFNFNLNDVKQDVKKLVYDVSGSTFSDIYTMLHNYAGAYPSIVIGYINEDTYQWDSYGMTAEIARFSDALDNNYKEGAHISLRIWERGTPRPYIIEWYNDGSFYRYQEIEELLFTYDESANTVTPNVEYDTLKNNLLSDRWTRTRITLNYNGQYISLRPKWMHPSAQWGELHGFTDIDGVLYEVIIYKETPGNNWKFKKRPIAELPLQTTMSIPRQELLELQQNQDKYKQGVINTFDVELLLEPQDKVLEALGKNNTIDIISNDAYFGKCHLIAHRYEDYFVISDTPYYSSYTPNAYMYGYVSKLTVNDKDYANCILTIKRRS